MRGCRSYIAIVPSCSQWSEKISALYYINYVHMRENNIMHTAGIIALVSPVNKAIIFCKELRLLFFVKKKEHVYFGPPHQL